MRRVCVTGGAGFIGSNFADELLANGIKVRLIDNFRTGRPEFVPDGAELFEADVSDKHTLLRAFDGCDWVAHFQANADVRRGFERPFFDVEQNAVRTAVVLDAMRQVGVTKVFFASSASVYGNLRMERIPESAPFPVQASLYGASKVYGEGLVSAYCEGYGFTGVIGRWVQIIGERYLHGHVIDFVRKMLRDPEQIEVLGDGQQRKSGLYVKDLARGILTAMREHDATHGAHVYNLGTNDTFTVNESAALIANRLEVKPKLHYTGRADGGWAGDNPHVLLDSSRIRALGWSPQLTVAQAIEHTVDWLLSPECTYL